MTDDNGVYVYGIVAAEHPVPVEVPGVGTPPARLRVLHQGPVAAVVSDAPQRLRARRRDLLAHQDLLMRLAEDGPVMPMRFGSIAPDESTVREQLVAGEDSHLATLELLAAKVEVNVKALPAADALAALVRQDAAVRRLREAARRRPDYEANVQLGAAIAAALSRRAAKAGRLAVRELSAHAHAVSAGPEVPGCELNTSFLVGRAAIDRFQAAARHFADNHRDHVELRVAGPLPCYSFVAAEPAPVRVGA